MSNQPVSEKEKGPSVHPSSFILHPSLRYLRLLGAFARFGLLNELAFRANFLVKLSVELIWLSLLLISTLELSLWQRMAMPS